MNTIPILYCSRSCYKTKSIQLLNQFLNLKIKLIYVESLNSEALNKVVNKSPTGNLPLLQVGDFFLSGTKAILKYMARVSEKSRSELIHSSEPEEMAMIEMWIDFCGNNIWPLYDNLVGMISGAIPANKIVFSEAMFDLMVVLGRINTHLQFKTFFVGYSYTLADLVMSTSLVDLYMLVIDNVMRDSTNNLSRWYTLVSNLKEFNSVFGPVRLCVKTQIPIEGIVAPTNTCNNSYMCNNSKKSSIETRSMAKKAKEESNNSTNNSTVTPQDQPQQEKKPPAQIFPESAFNLEEFKKEFIKQQRQSYWFN